MGTTKRLLGIGILIATLAACSDTHYVNGGLQLSTRANASTTVQTVVDTTQPPKAGVPYIMANINDGQAINNLQNASGNWLRFVNEQADPYGDLSADGVFNPGYPGYYSIDVRVSYASPNSTGAGTNFVPGAWPPNSSCSVYIMLNNGTTLVAGVTPVSGSTICQAHAHIEYPLGPTDQLAFYATVTSPATTITRAQLGMTTGFNPYNLLSVNYLHE